jgi:putative membrane protein
MHTAHLKNTTIAALIALASATSVYAQSDVASPDKTMPKKTATKSAVSAGDQKMMTQLAQANMAEIAAGELAQTKSSNEQVLKFSRQMIDDHSGALKDLSKLADDKGVKLPKETDAKHKDLLKKLNTMSPAEFDRAYISKAAVADHQEASKLVAKIASEAKDPDFKAMGEKLQPTIDLHLKMARELKAS